MTVDVVPPPSPSTSSIGVPLLLLSLPKIEKDGMSFIVVKVPVELDAEADPASMRSIKLSFAS